MADGQPGSADLTEWVPNPCAKDQQISTWVWSRFLSGFKKSSTSGYHFYRSDCYKAALTGDELAVEQWKAWELYLATAKLMGEI